MADLATLIDTEIPEGRQNLTDSHTNLERVAEYCEGNYFQAENKRAALEETKNYTTQSLASVAYQINTLAYNFLQMLDLQDAQLSEMESQMNHIEQTVMIHKEKVARREIGILTANKTITRQFKILAPSNPEKPIKYLRKPIDYSAMDDIGHGVKSSTSVTTPRAKRGSSQGSVKGLVTHGTSPSGPSSVPSNIVSVGPAPTTKPPTPPQAVRAGGTLAKGSREYRTPPAVAPPQVPSHYAPNYPMGHPRRSSERGVGYSTLPMPHGHNSAATQPQPPTSPPQVGMVHPITHSQVNSTSTLPSSYSSSMQQQHITLPRSIFKDTLPMQMGMMVDNHMMHGGSASPPLPPPPPEGSFFSGTTESTEARQPGIMPSDSDLPGWVPKNFIEKVVAIYDYYADKDDELSFQENAVIYVLKKNDDGWWEGVMDGITGLFPGNYVEPTHSSVARNSSIS